MAEGSTTRLFDPSTPSVLSTLPKDLPLDFLKTITHQFSEERIMGIGGFGTIYKGIMPDGQLVAVKRLAQNSPLSQDKAFTNEVQNMMSLQHENVLKFVGFCIEGQKKVVLNSKGRYVVADIFEHILCYEYLPMGSLHKNMFEVSTRLDWSTRFKIIYGICNGLSFLHSIPIVHMDLKPDNIMLDSAMVPKIANFELSRLFGQEQTRQNTQNVVGSYGYIAPEYLYRGEISTKSDIYSLGLLILEITTEQKLNPINEQPSAVSYIRSVRETWTEGHIASVYPRLYADNLREVLLCINIGLECVAIDRQKRPTIENIRDRLCNLH